MAMAAICGLTAPEIVGKVSCSGAPSVAEHNPRYLELCKYLDLPTLKDLAIKSARRLLGQWLVYEPDLFEVVDGKIITVKASPGTLLSDLFDLSSLEMNDWYPEYRRDKVRRPCDRIATDELRPEWSVTWDRCSQACKNAFASNQLGTPLVSDVMNTFWLENRRKFKVLEKHDRTMKRLDISVSKPHKRSAPEAGRRSKRIAREPPELSSSKKRGATDEVRDAKRQCLTTFTCDTVQPVRRGRSSPNACWICGYRITGKKDKCTFTCCKKVAHKACWKRQFKIRGVLPPLGGARCNQVVSYLKKDRYNEDHEARGTRKESSGSIEAITCELCEDDLTVRPEDNECVVLAKKNHYVYACRQVPGEIPNFPASRANVLLRIAALGIVKKIGKTGRRGLPENSQNSVPRIRSDHQRSDSEPPDTG